MSSNFECRYKRLPNTFKRKLLQIKLRGFLQVADRLGNRFPLGCCARLGIHSHKTSLFGGDQHSGKKHENNIAGASTPVNRHPGI